MARRRRHWRQRFDPALEMVFRRPCNLSIGQFKVGDAVPAELPVGLLRRFWNAHRIELAVYTPPGAKAKASETFRKKVKQAIRELDPEDRALWNGTDGSPKAAVIQRALRSQVSATIIGECWRSVRDEMLEAEADWKRLEADRKRLEDEEPESESEGVPADPPDGEGNGAPDPTTDQPPTDGEAPKEQ